MLFTKKVDERQIFKKALDGYFMKKGEGLKLVKEITL